MHQAMKDFDDGQRGGFGTATRWEVVRVFDDRKGYSPKAIVGLAAKYIPGPACRLRRPSDFNSVKARRLLKDLGFELRLKSGQQKG
jgi:hypothetical protein